MKSFLSIFQSVFQKCKGFFQVILGQISWTPPSWFSKIKQSASFASTWTKSNPKRFSRVLIASLSVLAVLIVGRIWYLKLPQVVRVQFQVINPSLTKYEEPVYVSPLVVNFKSSVAPLKLVGKPVTHGITISPKIEGTWTWQTDRVLQFVPKNDWDVGQEYKVNFEKGKIEAEHVKLEEYSFKFQSAPFTALIESMEFYQDPVNPKLKNVVATIRFSHPVDSSDVEKKVQLKFAEKKKGIQLLAETNFSSKIAYDKYKLKAFVHSDPVSIPEDDTYMKLFVDTGIRAAKGGEPLKAGSEQQIAIPGKYSFFQVSNSELALANNEKYETEQVFVLSMTNGVTSKEMDGKIEAYLLPKFHPNSKEEKKKPYNWSEPQEITPDILGASTKLKFDPIETQKEYDSIHSFRYTADVGRYVFVHIKKGMQSFGGYVLAKDFTAVERVPEFPEELQIIGNGSILSLNGEKKISVFTRDVPALNFEVSQVRVDQVHHFVSQANGGFKEPSFYEGINTDNLSERFTEKRELDVRTPGRANYTTFDLSKYLNRNSADQKGLFYVKIESYEPEQKWSRQKYDQRFFLVTDLGLLVKDSADNSHDVFVQSTRTGSPVAGAVVRVVGLNGLPVMTATSDAEGHVKFPSLEDFKREQRPVVYTAQIGNDFSFIPYNKGDRRLDYSKFDIGGVYEKNAADSMRAYLFSDRGIYRPGDQIHVGAIVKANNWKQNLSGVPLELVVEDARGLTVKKQTVRLNESGFLDIEHKTEDGSPTGTYVFNLSVIKDGKPAGLLGSTTVQVREFLPDEMKIASHFSQEVRDGWVTFQDLKANVTLQNLFGTPATNRRIAASISLSPQLMNFKKYSDFHFYDPSIQKEGYSENLSEMQTNDKGEAEFDLGLNRFKEATYRLRFIATGFVSEGGRSVVSESATMVSPYPYLVGYKADGDLGYITHDSKRSVDFIAIDPKLQKMAVTDLKSVLIERKYVSVLTKQENGTYKYESVEKKVPVQDKKLSLPATGLAYALPTNQPGDFTLQVQNQDGTVLNEVKFSIVGTANLTRSLEKNAELQLMLNKSDYDQGEEVELQIKAPYKGAGLITIERDKVYSVKWFKADTNTSVQRIKLPDSIEGNGYVSVSFIRDINAKEIFMSPLSYGVVPFVVNRKKQTLDIKLGGADLAKPGQTYKMKYSSNRPAKIVVFAVDEGILQVAGYHTPDPLSYFFQKRALEVNTFQILDLIMPEHKLLMESSGVGGDGFASLGQNLNPFKRRTDKPVVYWSGILDSGPEAKELKYEIPDSFNGALRLMAVAVEAGAIGVSEKQTTVRGDFVISPNAPLVVTPGDEFDVSVGVANNLAGSGKNAAISLEVVPSKQLEVVGDTKITLNIDEMREGTAIYHVKVKSDLGSSELAFTASAGGKSAKRKITMSVRPATPYQVALTMGYQKKGNQDLVMPRSMKMFPDYRVNEVTASPLPLSLAHGLIKYLEKYPYGCTEQLVSQALPALALRNKTDFGYSPKVVDETLKKVLSTLQSRQRADGAFGLWAANSNVDNTAHAYAVNFLLEAKEKTYVPEEMMQFALNYLKTIATSEGKNMDEERLRAYTIYLLTRSGTVTTSYLSLLEERLNERYKNQWRTDLTAAYMAATYQLLKQTAKANELIKPLKFKSQVPTNYHYYYDALLYDAHLMLLITKHFPERVKQIKSEDFQMIADMLTKGGYNTPSSAFMIMGLATYADVAGPVKAQNVILTETVGSEKKTIDIPQSLFPKMKFDLQASALNLQNEGPLGIFYGVTQAGFDAENPKEPIRKKLEIEREYTDKEGKVIQTAKVGDEIEVHIKLRTIDTADYANVAIVDLLPGGFDVVMSKPAPAQSVQPSQSPTNEYGEGDEGCEDCGSEDAGESDQPNEQVETSTNRGFSMWVSPIGSEKSTFMPEYVDIREDRVVIYGDAMKDMKEFVYTIKATNVGTFVVPPAFSEDMYDRTVQARSMAGTFTVTKN